MYPPPLYNPWRKVFCWRLKYSGTLRRVSGQKFRKNVVPPSSEEKKSKKRASTAWTRRQRHCHSLKRR